MGLRLGTALRNTKHQRKRTLRAFHLSRPTAKTCSLKPRPPGLSEAGVPDAVSARCRFSDQPRRRRQVSDESHILRRLPLRGGRHPQQFSSAIVLRSIAPRSRICQNLAPGAFDRQPFPILSAATPARPSNRKPFRRRRSVHQPLNAECPSRSATRASRHISAPAPLDRLTPACQTKHRQS